MGKQFVTRTRQDWETLAHQDAQETRGVRTRATVWLTEMLQRYSQATPETPLTLAVPDRFWETLGDTPESSTDPDVDLGS